MFIFNLKEENKLVKECFINHKQKLINIRKKNEINLW